MKKSVILTFLFLSASAILTGYLFAGDSVSISVSCTVPAIPGLNAPFLENTAERQSIASSSTVNEPAVQSIEEEDEEKEINSQGEEEIVLVRTFYAR